MLFLETNFTLWNNAFIINACLCFRWLSDMLLSVDAVSLSDWRGGRKLPSLVKVVSAKTEREKRIDSRVKLLTSQHRDSYSRALENQHVSVDPQNANTSSKKSSLWKVGANPAHFTDRADTVSFRKDRDSDISSLGSYSTDSQHTSSGSYRDGSSEDSRSLHDEQSNQRAWTLGKRRGMPATPPSKFQFRRSSSRLDKPEISDSPDYSSADEAAKRVLEVKSGRVIFQESVKKSVSNRDSLMYDTNLSADERSNFTKPSSDRLYAKQSSSSDESHTISRSLSEQDSFDEIYKSNYSRFAHLMAENQRTASAGRFKPNSSRRKRVLPQCPGKGKSVQLLLQKSLSLSEEVAANARYQSFEEEDDKCIGQEESAEKVEEQGSVANKEKLLMRNETGSKQNVQDVGIFASIEHETSVVNSRISVKQRLCLFETKKADKKTLGVLEEEASGSSLEKTTMRSDVGVTQKGCEVSTDHQYKPGKSGLTEARDKYEFTKNIQEGPKNVKVNLSRSGSNVSDATAVSELQGEAENFASIGAEDSDDTLNSSDIGDCFSDDDNMQQDLSYDILGPLPRRITHGKIITEEDDEGSFENVHGKKTTSRTISDHDHLQLQFHKQQKVLKYDTSSRTGDETADRTSQRSLVPENSNPEGYSFERQPSVNSQVSNLDSEVEALQRSASSPVTVRQKTGSLKMSAQSGIYCKDSQSLEGDVRIERLRNLEHKVTDSTYNQTSVSSIANLLEGSGQKKTTLLLLAMNCQEESGTDSSSDYPHDTHLPDANEDLDYDYYDRNKSGQIDDRRAPQIKSEGYIFQDKGR